MMRCICFFAISLLLLSCSDIELSNEIGEILKPNQTMEMEIDLNGKTIAFYNVENLFDTIDQEGIHDEWFTPKSETEWNTTKYFDKCKNIGQVLSSISEDLPVCIGLVEIENEQVLKDLIKYSDLFPGDYSIVTEESPDERGIDVGFLYRPAFFDYRSHEVITIDFPRYVSEEEDFTRDILHVEGKLGNETIHCFVNHWPSRREGLEKSEKKRIYVAQELRLKIDEIVSANESARILVMGDFNDYPDNTSIRDHLKATGEINLDNDELFNLAFELHSNGKGTYNYQGDWGMLDQMIINDNFLDVTSGVGIKNNEVTIFEEEWLLFRHPKYGDARPNKTYSGSKYHGGYSDHLPIYITLSE